MSSIPPTKLQIARAYIDKAIDQFKKGWQELVHKISSFTTELFREIGLTSRTFDPREREINLLRGGQYVRLRDLHFEQTRPEEEAKIASTHQKHPFEDPNVRRAVPFFASALEVSTPAFAKLRQWVDDSLKELTEKRGHEEVKELVTSLISSSIVGPVKDSDELKQKLDLIYRGWFFQTSEKDILELVNDPEKFTSSEIYAIQRFIRGWYSLNKPDYRWLFDDLSPEKRELFHQLFKNHIFDKLTASSPVKLPAEELTRFLREELIQRSGISRITEAGERQAIDSTEELLYPLLDLIENDPNFVKAKKEFNELINRPVEEKKEEGTGEGSSIDQASSAQPTNEPTEIKEGEVQIAPVVGRFSSNDKISPLPFYLLLKSEGKEDPLTRYFKSHAEDLENQLRPVLSTLAEGEEGLPIQELIAARLPDLLSSERHLKMILGQEKRAPQVDPAKFDTIEGATHLVATPAVEMIFKRLVAVDQDEGVRLAMDEIWQRADAFAVSLLSASKSGPKPQSVLDAFKKTVVRDGNQQILPNQGCHSAILSRSIEGVTPGYRLALQNHMGVLLDAVKATFLNERELKQVYHALWERKEILRPLFGGQDWAFIYDVVMEKMISTELEFVEVANEFLLTRLAALRGQIIDLVIDKVVLEQSEPATFQRLLTDKILPSLAPVLRTTALSTFYLNEVKKDKAPFPLSSTLWHYLQGTEAEKAAASLEMTKQLQGAAIRLKAKYPDKSLKIDSETILDVQRDLLLTLKNLPKATKIESFSNLLKSASYVDERQYFLNGVLKAGFEAKAFELFTSFVAKQEENNSEQAAAVSKFLDDERKKLHDQGIEISDIHFESAKTALLKELSSLDPETDRRAIKEHLKKAFEPAPALPPELTAYGSLPTRLVLGFGSILPGWLTPFIEKTVAQVVVPIFSSIRNAKSPLGTILSLSQPALTDLFSRKNIKEMLTNTKDGETSRLHEAVSTHAAKGYQIIVVGHKSDERTKELAKIDPSKTTVVEKAADLTVEEGQKVFYVLSQDLPSDFSEPLKAAIESKFPDSETIHRDLKGGVEELALIIKIIVESSDVIPSLIPERFYPSKEYYQNALVSIIDGLTDQNWKIENLFLHALDVIIKYLATPSSTWAGSGGSIRS